LYIGLGLAIAGALLLANASELRILGAYLPEVQVLGMVLGIAEVVIMGAFVRFSVDFEGSPWLSAYASRDRKPPSLPLRSYRRESSSLAAVFSQSLALSGDDNSRFQPPWALAVAAVAVFATQGAPGGLGVREAMISAGLFPYLGADQSMTVAIIFRVSTIGRLSSLL
jgi:hypothetical protein